jgi:hypothetical protein
LNCGCILHDDFDVVFEVDDDGSVADNIDVAEVVVVETLLFL